MKHILKYGGSPALRRSLKPKQSHTRFRDCIVFEDLSSSLYLLNLLEPVTEVLVCIEEKYTPTILQSFDKNIHF